MKILILVMFLIISCAPSSETHNNKIVCTEFKSFQNTILIYTESEVRDELKILYRLSHDASPEIQSAIFNMLAAVTRSDYSDITILTTIENECEKAGIKLYGIKQ